MRDARRKRLAGLMVPNFERGVPDFGTGAAPATGRLPPVALSSSIGFDFGVPLGLLWNLPRQLSHKLLPTR